MKKQLVYLLVWFGLPMLAQTGIGTTTPHASAKLEVASTTQGFLPPRVALTATNSASPISNPANGLMVFNTTSAGASPFNVVPGYYYWDGTGQQWVSLSTTVGNVQNQALFRSSSNTSAGQAITSWNSRFNNIASGDLTITSLTEFVLSNGIYKIEWALPFQSSNTYNTLVLQELSSGSWGTFRGDAAYASLSNGGNTDWGGGTFAADILDCSLAPKTIRIINNDGSSRTLFKGVTLIITKLNPSITTSTTADNLGNHTATRNILLNGNFISNDGGNEGIRVDNSGNVGIGTTLPTNSIHVENGNVFGPDPGNTTSPSVYIYNNNNASTTAHSSLAIRTNGNGGGNPYLSFDIGGVRGYSMGIDNADGDKFKFYTNWNLNNSVAPAFTVTTDNRVGIGTTSPASRLHINSSDPTTLYIESTTSDNNGLVILNANTPSNWNVNHHEFMMFQKQGTTIGFIGAVANNNSINYSTTSDYRLKMDLQNYSGLNLVNKIKTYDYAWKNDNSRMYGVMAHELQEVIPYAVSGIKDAIDKEGKITPQAVDYSKLTPVLVKAIQEQDVKLKEQQLQIEALMKRLELLESKIK
jgi:hypothetical protein